MKTLDLAYYIYIIMEFDNLKLWRRHIFANLANFNKIKIKLFEKSRITGTLEMATFKSKFQVIHTN